MGDINNVTLSGNLCRDAELKYTNTGKAIMNFSIAINMYNFKEKKEVAHFFECLKFGEESEKILKYMKKGKKIGVQGKLMQERWEDREGKKNSKIKIYVNEITFFSYDSDKSEKSNNSECEIDADQNYDEFDDIPF